MNRKKARQLLPAMIDNEVSEAEKNAFLAFIRHHPDIKKEYEELLLVKQLLAKKLKRHKPPAHLLAAVRSSVQEMNAAEAELHTPAGITEKSFRFLMSVAAVMLITLPTLQLLNSTRHKHYHPPGAVMIEQAVNNFFVNTALAKPGIARPLPGMQANQNMLEETYHIPAKIPIIEGAGITEILMIPISKNFEAPLLVYEQSGSREKIYLFIFELGYILASSSVFRHSEAVKQCQTHNDYFISKMDRNEVVSWLWDNYWYTAVSNINGEEFVKLIQTTD